MALARLYNQAAGGIQSTLADAYADRLARPSDIREYLPLLHGTVAGIPGCRVLELGTRKGNSTLAFLAAAETVGGHVWSVDIDPCDRDPAGMGPWAGCPLWTFTRGDDLNPGVAANQPSEVDVLFIDTSHLLVPTRAELALYVPRVAPGGVVLCHDTRVFMWQALEGPDPAQTPPVQQALDEYCAAHGLEWTDTEGDYGLGVIHVA